MTTITGVVLHILVLYMLTFPSFRC